MARPANETNETIPGHEVQKPGPSTRTILEKTARRESYIAGEPDSAPELVRFIGCKATTDIDNIKIEDLLITAI